MSGGGAGAEGTTVATGTEAHDAAASARQNERSRHACIRGDDSILISPVMHRYIAIEGPIGVGKTALATRLAARLDATTVLEETENPFLADFYAGKPGAALQTQLFYLLNRHRQQLSLRQGQLFAQVTIADYLFDRDKIFAYLNLDDNELFIYQRLYDLLVKDVPAPDLVVYLQAPTDVLARRRRARDRDQARETP